METVHSRVLCLLVAVVYTSAINKLPSYITPCHLSDPHFNECVVRSGRAAIPSFIHGDSKYRVPNLDPLEIERLSVQQGTRQVGLNLTLSHAKMYGMENALFKDARMDMKNGHMEWDFENEKGLQILGPYEASGQVLLLPITGSGQANITLTQLKVVNKFDFELIKKKNGKEYMNVTHGEMKFDVGKAYFNLENLFNGEKLLGDNMNRFLNENWRELIKEFGPEVGIALTEVFRRILAGIVSQVPYDIAFPE